VQLRSDAETALREALQQPATPPRSRPVAAGLSGSGWPMTTHPDPPAAVPAGGPPAGSDWAVLPAGRPRRSRLLVGGAVVALVAALVTARLMVRSADEAVRAATADRLAALSSTAVPLDTAVLLAAEAFRLADTSASRAALETVVTDHPRVLRAVSFAGNPLDPVLSGGRVVTFGTGVSVLGWSVATADPPHLLMGIPPEWGAWIVAAPSPVDEVVLGAGVAGSGPWLRTVSARDGTSRLLLQGEQLGGRPVDGAVRADGARALLLVAAPAAEAPDDGTRWTLLDVDLRDGTRRPTGISGTTAVAVEGVRADFADDGGTFVVWDDTGSAPAVLVDVGTARQTAVTAPRDPTRGTGFRAFPGGAAQLWDDGAVTLVGPDGSTVQRLGVHGSPVQDVVVAPDGTWAVTVDAVGRVVRWDVDPVTRRWSGSESLAGHTASVVGVEVDAAGRTLVTVSRDHSILSWRMGPRDGGAAHRAPDDPAAWLAAACAVAARDLEPAEWRRYLPGRPWRSTCSDLG
jgi:hypothetical protein